MGGTFNAYMCVQRDREVKTSFMRCICTKWMALNKCYGICFVHWPGQVPRASSPEREMFFVSIIRPHVRLFYPMRNYDS